MYIYICIYWAANRDSGRGNPGRDPVRGGPGPGPRSGGPGRDPIARYRTSPAAICKHIIDTWIYIYIYMIV